ncbi:MAG: hypothetical protein WC370_00720 [Dehalococcoidales bacterium]|jgi:hypothetical protein
MTEPGPLRCATHPDVETNLRCGKCGKLICPRCLVQTPVGARCRDCAKIKRLPTYRLSSAYYLRATGAALGAAAVIGVGWGLITGLFSFIYLNLILAAGVGYAIAEITGLAVNRKRGLPLAIIGSAGVFFCYLVNIFTFGRIPGLGLGLLLDIIAVAVAVSTAVSRLR